MGLDTPVLLMAFNRPDTTAVVLDRILQAQPADLFVAADGPRADRPADELRCRETRALFDQVPPRTRVHRLLRETNLGCRAAVSSAISWFFSNVDRGIIVEDDCLPEPSFFGFCDRGLQEYEDEPAVKIISGQNPFGSFPAPEDAIFSRYAFIWGWATWRRTWREYDVELADWPSAELGGRIRDWLGSKHPAAFWFAYFDSIKKGFNTWDVQLNYLLYKSRGLAAISKVNLVRNIGFLEDATHTRDPRDSRQHLPVFAAPTVPRFPRTVAPNEKFDAKLVRRLFYREELTVRGRIKGVLRAPYHRLKTLVRARG